MEQLLLRPDGCKKIAPPQGLDKKKIALPQGFYIDSIIFACKSHFCCKAFVVISRAAILCVYIRIQSYNCWNTYVVLCCMLLYYLIEHKELYYIYNSTRKI